MVENIKIRKYQNVDFREVCLLIAKTFRKFNSKEGTKKGVKDFVNFYRHYKLNREKILVEFNKNNIFYVALNDFGEIIGVVIGNKNRLCNLFVDEDYQGRGIGIGLLKKFESECRSNGSKEINIRSSLHGVSFYEKNGYKKVSYVTSMKGVMVQPMVKRLK